MIEMLLTYIGTLLIALEFVRGAKLIRGIKNLQALVGMLLAWPFKPYLNAVGSKGSSVKIKGLKMSLTVLLLLYALLFLIIMLPITVAFYALYFIISPLELIHLWVNRLYFVALKEYRPTYGFWTRFTLKSYKVPKRITEERVIKELQKGEIPVLPIVGIILITVALLMQIL
ncbi:MAG: hypothetical protein V1932_00015 [Chloroflexota bacterium]